MKGRTLIRGFGLTAVNALLYAIPSPAAEPPEEPLSLWYDEPATEWTEALPVGQGRLGAMVFGGVARERIQFNEDTVWQGAPHDYANKGSHKHLGELRRLLWAGKQSEAEDLAMERFMSVPLGQKAYQAFGDLQIEILGVDESDVSDYRRDLNLDTAIASVQFQARHLRGCEKMGDPRPPSILRRHTQFTTLRYRAQSESDGPRAGNRNTPRHASPEPSRTPASSSVYSKRLFSRPVAFALGSVSTF